MPELLAGKDFFADPVAPHDPNTGGYQNYTNFDFEALFPMNMERMNSLNNMERMNSNNAYLAMERAGSNNGLWGHRQLSFDKSFDKDLMTYLDENSFLNPYAAKGEPFGSTPIPMPYTGKEPQVLPVPEPIMEAYIRKPEPQKPEVKPKVTTTPVVPQQNVKYYGLCPHKLARSNCPECQENRTPLSKNIRRTSSSSSGRSKKRRPMQFWTEEEDIQLWKAIEQYGTRKWMAIAKKVPGKDHKQCLQRWNKVLNPKLKKGRWKESEDRTLIQLVREQTKDDQSKSIKWNMISEAMGECRSAKQCRERWVNHLNPEVTKKAWTDEEDRTLWALHEKFPNKWANISRCLPGRSESMVKSRLTKLMKMKGVGNRKSGAGGKRTRKTTQQRPTKKVKTTKESTDKDDNQANANVLNDALQLFENNF